LLVEQIANEIIDRFKFLGYAIISSSQKETQVENTGNLRQSRKSRQREKRAFFLKNLKDKRPRLSKADLARIGNREAKEQIKTDIMEQYPDIPKTEIDVVVLEKFLEEYGKEFTLDDVKNDWKDNHWHWVNSRSVKMKG
jgi:hypothetical protein